MIIFIHVEFFSVDTQNISRNLKLIAFTLMRRLTTTNYIQCSFFSAHRFSKLYNFRFSSRIKYFLIFLFFFKLKCLKRLVFLHIFFWEFQRLFFIQIIEPKCTPTTNWTRDKLLTDCELWVSECLQTVNEFLFLKHTFFLLKCIFNHLLCTYTSVISAYFLFEERKMFGCGSTLFGYLYEVLSHLLNPLYLLFT